MPDLGCKCPSCHSSQIENLGFRIPGESSLLCCCNQCGTTFWKVTDQPDVPVCSCGALASDMDEETGDYRCSECGLTFRRFSYAVEVSEDEIDLLGCYIPQCT